MICLPRRRAWTAAEMCSSIGGTEGREEGEPVELVKLEATRMCSSICGTGKHREMGPILLGRLEVIARCADFPIDGRLVDSDEKNQHALCLQLGRLFSALICYMKGRFLL